MKESNGKKNHQLVGLKGGYSLEYKISATLTTESQTDIFELMITDELVEIIVELILSTKYSWENIQKNHHASQDIWRVIMLDYSIKMIFVYTLLLFCTMELFINQYTVCIKQMTKYLKHLASEK